MGRTLAFRIAVVLLGFDLVFVAIATAAHVDLLGLRAADQRAFAFGVSGLVHAIRIVFWLAVLHRLARPVDAWLRLDAAGERDLAALRSAGRAAYRFPLRFGLILSLAWAAAFLALTAILLRATPGVVLELRLLLAGCFFAAATMLAAFPFGFLWAEYLAGPARVRLSTAARAQGEAIRTTRLPLRTRILLLALCLTLAPTMWLLSLGISFTSLHAPATTRMLVYYFTAVALWAPVCAWLLAQTMARPIATIASAVTRIGRTGWIAGTVPIPIYQNDELGSLAAGANEMIDRLADELDRRAAIARENERLLRAAHDAARVREQFLLVASHELRTPLTPLRLNLESLQRELEQTPDGAEFARRLEVGLRQVERLARLTEDLLQVSAAGAEAIQLQLETVDLNEIVRSVCARFEEEAARRGCELRLSADGPVQARADPIRLDRVVAILLDNALKFGAGKPVHVRVEGDARVSRISVQDAGIGISPEDQARVFERFERAVSDRYYGGLGIGLYLARLIVDAHGGDLRIRSRPGAGTTVTVELPAAGSQAASAVADDGAPDAGRQS